MGIIFPTGQVPLLLLQGFFLSLYKALNLQCSLLQRLQKITWPLCKNILLPWKQCEKEDQVEMAADSSC